MAQIDLFHLLFPQRITSYGTMSSIATLLQFCFVCIHSQLNVANIEFPAWSSYTLLMLHGILFPDAWLLSCPFAHIWAQECLIHMFGEKRSTWSERETMNSHGSAQSIRAEARDIAFTRAPLNVRGLVMIFTQYTFNKLSFHPGSSYCSHARTTYVMDQGFSVPFEIFPCRIWSPTPQPAFARHRPSLYIGPLVQWRQQSPTLAVWRRLLGVSCFNYFEQLLCLVPQNTHLNMCFALFRSDWILPPPSDPSWWERRPWERRPRDEVAPPPPNRDRSRSPLAQRTDDSTWPAPDDSTWPAPPPPDLLHPGHRIPATPPELLEPAPRTPESQ